MTHLILTATSDEEEEEKSYWHQQTTQVTGHGVNFASLANTTKTVEAQTTDWQKECAQVSGLLCFLLFLF